MTVILLSSWVLINILHSFQWLLFKDGGTHVRAKGKLKSCLLALISILTKRTYTLWVSYLYNHIWCHCIIKLVGIFWFSHTSYRENILASINILTFLGYLLTTYYLGSKTHYLACWNELLVKVRDPSSIEPIHKITYYDIYLPGLTTYHC